MLSSIVDGQTHDMLASEGENMADISRLKVTTESTEHLTLEFLTDSCNYLCELRRFLLQTVELYRTGDETKGRELFMELIQGLEWLVKIASTTEQLLIIDVAGASCAGPTLTDSVDSLNRILLEIIVAQENQDWVLRTDLLEYELAPQLEQWIEIFTMLQHRDSDFIGECLRS
jgi:hypothetical protein